MKQFKNGEPKIERKRQVYSPWLLAGEVGRSYVLKDGLAGQGVKMNKGAVPQPEPGKLEPGLAREEEEKQMISAVVHGWDGYNLQSARLLQAQKALKELGEWYELVFDGEAVSSAREIFSRQLFFNSHLIYFIAATDDNEDNIGHSQYVASYSLILARALGIEDESFLVDLERGALLHDIGKIGLPPAILCKKTPLTPLEREIIKEHPILGYLLLQDYLFLRGAAEIVLYHHERYDGGGYPFGLAGEDIPLAARIFAVADTLDAITSDRPYRRGQSFEVAKAEIIRGSGSQFDPSVVDVFLSLPREKWELARREAWRTFRLPLIH